MRQTNKTKYILLALLMTLAITTAAAVEPTMTIVNSAANDTFRSGPVGVPLGKLTNGTKVIPFEATDYCCHVKFPDGQTGWVDWAVLSENTPPMARYNKRKEQYYRKDKLEKRVLGKSKAELTDQFGQPGALIKNKDATETWHYSNVVMVDGATRYKCIQIQIQKDKATAIKPEGRARTAWVEKLPLAYTLRGMSYLNITEPDDLLGFTRNWPWIFKVLFGLLRILLAFAFFTLPGIGAYIISGKFQEMKQLSNQKVKLAGLAVMFSVNYLYFLFLSLHMVRHIDGFMAFVIAALLVSTYRYYYTEINYHRCAKCHTMRKVVDKGTKEVGREFITRERTREVYSHTTGGVDYYTTQIYYEKTTRIDYEDYRECTVCQHEWPIAYSITKPGHEPKTEANSHPNESLNPRRSTYVKQIQRIYKKIKELYERTSKSRRRAR
ncbi:MAG: SH3 domain-containing protein [bacterium]|nr:SH3 domain-containing protein [bacterium]